jgi:hypothetical protein
MTDKIEKPYFERGVDDLELIRAVMQHENYLSVESSFPRLRHDALVIGIPNFLVVHAECAAGIPQIRPKKREYAKALGELRRTLKQVGLQRAESETVRRTLIDLSDSYLAEHFNFMPRGRSRSA